MIKTIRKSQIFSRKFKKRTKFFSSSIHKTCVFHVFSYKLPIATQNIAVCMPKIRLTCHNLKNISRKNCQNFQNSTKVHKRCLRIRKHQNLSKFDPNCYVHSFSTHSSSKIFHPQNIFNSHPQYVCIWLHEFHNEIA